MLEKLNPLLKNSLKRKFKAGSTILYQGEIPRSACIINKGIVRVFSISSEGEEQIIMYHLPGEFFPSPWIFSKTTSTMFFYEAMDDDCEIIFVEKPRLLEYISSDQDITIAVLDYFTSHYTASLLQVNALDQSKARNKLLYTIYYICLRYGKPKDNKTEIMFSLTHQNIASIVGLTRETAAVEINKLRKEKILNYHNQKYIVDTDKLLEIIGEESFKNIDIGLA